MGKSEFGIGIVFILLAVLIFWVLKSPTPQRRTAPLAAEEWVEGVDARQVGYIGSDTVVFCKGCGKWVRCPPVKK